jgi:biotin carboxyl carrier protein
VGFFRPGADQSPGVPVRAGDRLGTIDVLGVPHELVAPTDGIMGTWLVEPGEPVEYGQEVVEIELPAAPDAERGEDG